MSASPTIDMANISNLVSGYENLHNDSDSPTRRTPERRFDSSSSITLARKELLDAEIDVKKAEAERIRGELRLKEREMKLREDILKARLEEVIIPEMQLGFSDSSQGDKARIEILY